MFRITYTVEVEIDDEAKGTVLEAALKEAAQKHGSNVSVDESDCEDLDEDE